MIMITIIIIIIIIIKNLTRRSDVYLPGKTYQASGMHYNGSSSL